MSEFFQDTKKLEVTLREVTKATVWDILQLKPADDQKQFVASIAESIAEAYFNPDYAWFRAIYADECPVGFVMIGINEKEDFCFLWRFMIDQKYQRKNFGKMAMEALFKYLKSKTNVLTIITSYHEGKGDPSGFYKKIGFIEADEVVKQSELGKRIEESGEIVLQLRL